MKRLSAKVILGTFFIKYLVGRIGSWLVVFGVNCFFALWSPARQVREAHQSTPHLVAIYLFGLVLNIGSGYLVASWSRTAKMANAAVLAILCFGLNQYLIAQRLHTIYPSWFMSLIYPSFLALMLGAWWRVRTH
jgi:hypothetical protein